MHPLFTMIDFFYESKKLKQKDEKVEVVNCLHRGPKITHTNGSIQCLQCMKMLKVVEPKWRK